MAHISWKTLDYELEIYSLGKMSAVFSQTDRGNKLLFLYEADAVFLMLFLYNGYRFVLGHSEKIRSENLIKVITGNNNCIFMLDVKNNLHYLELKNDSLVAPFNLSLLDLLAKEGTFLTWQKLHIKMNCFNAIGFTDTLVIIYKNESEYISLHKTTKNPVSLIDLSHKKLNFLSKGKCFLKKLDSKIGYHINKNLFNNVSSDTGNDEILVIIQPMCFCFSRVNPFGIILSPLYCLDFDPDSVLDILSFSEKSLILIVCNTGQIVCLKFHSSWGSFKLIHLKLPKPIFAITGYIVDNHINLLWSDLCNLQLSILQGSMDFLHLQLTQNIKGIKHFVKMPKPDIILAVTRNGSFYMIPINISEEYSVSDLPSYQIINIIYDTAKLIEKLNGHIAEREDLIYAIEFHNIPGITENIIVAVNGKTLVIENNTGSLCRKELWKIQFECKSGQHSDIEIQTLYKNIDALDNISFGLSDIIPCRLKFFLDFEKNPNAFISLNLCVKKTENVTMHEDVSLIKFSEYLNKKFNFII